MPHFDKRGARILELSGARYISIIPIVEGDSASRSAWETWSVQNPWIPETYRPEGVPPNVSLTNPEIFRLGEGGVRTSLVSEPGQLLYPVWQVYPILPSVVNLELLSTFSLEVAGGLLDDVTTGGGTIYAPQGDEGENPEIPQTWPTTSMFAPIFDDFDGAGKLSGIIVSVVPWHNFFRNILPEGTREMLLIIRSTCGPSLTYQVQGPHVRYVGAGDLHDPDFEHLEVVGSFDGDHEASASAGGDCFLEFSVYPTKEYYDSFRTKNPVYFTLTVVIIFFLTSMVFVVYDCFVEKRQDKVVQQLNAIVSSLFPAQVVNRLMGEDQPNEHNDSTRTFSSGSNGAANGGGDAISNLLSTKPIGKFLFALSRPPVMQCFVE
jgi:hypothetical protein